MTTFSVTNKKHNPFFIEKPATLMMLKDYLRDDFSSCSSNGFKSFPRRQCCTTTTVRFLLEIDLNNTSTTTKSKKNYNSAKLHRHKQQILKKNTSSKSVHSSTFSALHKAVINAVKLLPFPSSSFSKSSSPSPSKLLPRKLFKRCFSKKTDGSGGKITRWRLFHQFLEEKNDKQQSINPHTDHQLSTSSSSNSGSNSWSEGEFNGNSESYSSISSRRNDAVSQEGEKHLPKDKNVSDVVGETVAKEWPNEDKEHFSPVSVLDCPFHDEEEELDPPFQRRIDRVEGSKRKFMSKIRSLESLSRPEPLNLEKQIELAGLEDDESNSLSIDNKKETAQELVEYVKATLMPSTSVIFQANGMLLDFFREAIHENNARNSNSSKVKRDKEFKQEQIEVVKDWINGHPQEMFLGWEVKDSRHVYVKDMERNGKWRNMDEEKEELVSELELEIFTTMVNEALLDLL